MNFSSVINFRVLFFTVISIQIVCPIWVFFQDWFFYLWFLLWYWSSYWLYSFNLVFCNKIFFAEVEIPLYVWNDGMVTIVEKSNFFNVYLSIIFWLSCGNVWMCYLLFRLLIFQSMIILWLIFDLEICFIPYNGIKGVVYSFLTVLLMRL